MTDDTGISAAEAYGLLHGIGDTLSRAANGDGRPSDDVLDGIAMEVDSIGSRVMRQLEKDRREIQRLTERLERKQAAIDWMKTAYEPDRGEMKPYTQCNQETDLTDYQ